MFIKRHNSTAVCYFHAMGGTRSPLCNKLSTSIWVCYMEIDICLFACHLPGALNINADKSSKEFNEKTEWQLHSAIFCKIIVILGTTDIDLFECRLDHQLPKYVSWKPVPGACHTDAFSFSWSGKFVYIFPPFSLLNRCLQKLENDCSYVADAGLVTPTVQGSHNPTKIRDSTTKPRNQMRLMACLLSGNTMKQEECQGQLSDCSWRPCEEVQRNSIPGISNNGRHFVSKGELIIFNHLQEQFWISFLNVLAKALLTVLLTVLEVCCLHVSLVGQNAFEIFQSRPHKPKYTEVCDIQVVLAYLATFHPADSMTLKTFKLKLVMLLFLVSGQRGQTIHLLDMNHMVATDDKYAFLYLTLEMF